MMVLFFVLFFSAENRGGPPRTVFFHRIFLPQHTSPPEPRHTVKAHTYTYLSSCVVATVTGRAYYLDEEWASDDMMASKECQPGWAACRWWLARMFHLARYVLAVTWLRVSYLSQRRTSRAWLYLTDLCWYPPDRHRVWGASAGGACSVSCARLLDCVERKHSLWPAMGTFLLGYHGRQRRQRLFVRRLRFYHGTRGPRRKVSKHFLSRVGSVQVLDWIDCP